MLYTLQELQQMPIVEKDDDFIIFRMEDDDHVTTTARIPTYFLALEEVAAALNLSAPEQMVFPEVFSVIGETIIAKFAGNEHPYFQNESGLNKFQATVESYDTIDIDFEKHGYVALRQPDIMGVHYIKKDIIADAKIQRNRDDLATISFVKENVIIPIQEKDLIQYANENNILPWLTQLII